MIASSINALVASTTGTKGSHGLSQEQLSVYMKAGLLLLALFITIPMDIGDLSLALVGAICFWMTRRMGDRGVKSKKFIACKLADDDTNIDPPSLKQHLRQESRSVSPPKQVKALTVAKQDHRQASAVPVLAPKFESSGWDAEVNELLGQIQPTEQSHEVVDHLVRIVEQAIKPLFPEANVEGFVNGNPVSAKAFGVAVPEVDIVVNASAEALMQAVPSSERMSSRQIQKCVIRTCCGELVKAGLKFRRSAFQSDEPKVTLLVPAHVSLADVAFAMNFSVNTVTASRSVNLLKECDKLDSRARELVLLVQRWARDRGIAHAAKGHLPLYAWSLLSIYFLQVGAADGPLLPPLVKENFAQPPRRTKEKGSAKKRAPGQSAGAKKASATLFKEFVQFYMSKFDWNKEIVSVRLASRTQSKFQCIPFVQDPFEVASNVGAGITSEAIDRLREEFARAGALCSQDESLAKLLEPWAPPVDALAAKDDEDGDLFDAENWRQPTLQQRRTATPQQSKKLEAVSTAKPGSLTGAIPQRLSPNSAGGVGVSIAAPPSLRPGGLVSLSATANVSLRPGGGAAARGHGRCAERPAIAS